MCCEVIQHSCPYYQFNHKSASKVAYGMLGTAYGFKLL